jgi:hypothetical protein
VIAATIALEMIGPMPGTVISRSQPLSACARLSPPCLPDSCPGISAAFTTIAFDGRWLEIGT